MSTESLIDIEELQVETDETEEQDNELTPLHYDISIYPSDFTLEVLHKKWQKKEIIMPKFQRDFVWNKKQASKLVESFMMGLPIPPIFLAIQPDQTFLVIDGRQRLQSVFYFFEGYFGQPDSTDKRKIFKLEGINKNSPLFRKSFSDFTDVDKRKLENQTLRAIIVRQLHPENDMTSIYHIFERLNTGGTPLNEQEVRNCVYFGKLNDLLIELNRYPPWRKILGKPKLDPRQKDVQIILRYMALLHNNRTYSRPMKDFLSTFMKSRQNPSDEFIDYERKRFMKICDIILAELGERPFNPKGLMNPSFFEAVSIAIAKNIDTPPINLKNKFHSLKENHDFKRSISEATMDTDAVKKRLEIAEQVLFK